MSGRATPAQAGRVPTDHVLENPLVPGFLDGHEVGVTLVLIALLGGVFLKGFSEAIGIAVGLVAVYLALNLVVVTVALEHLVANPELVADWRQLLTTSYSSPLAMVAVALLVFPKLALGLSGFETGVAVMPLVRGDPADPPERPRGRIRYTRKLLTTSALIMSGFLITSSVATRCSSPTRSSRKAARPAAAPSPTWPMRTWAAGLGRPMT